MEAVYGEVDLDNDLRDPVVVTMKMVGDGSHPGWRRYTADIDVARAGNFGFTVRVVPDHPAVDDYAAFGRVAWASPTGNQPG